VEGEYLRRGTAEFIGAFALTFFGAASVLIFAPSGGTIEIALAHGLAIALAVTFFAHISGGHFNPAITLGFLVTGRIEAGLAAVYWLMQLAGASVAALFLWWIFPAEVIGQSRLGAPTLHPSIGQGAGFMLEAIMTFFLVLAVFAVAVDERGAFKAVAGFGIGLVITMGVLAGGPLTGAAMNPSRAFGPEIVYRVWESYTWIYYVGPAAGAVVAALLYEWLYLRPKARTEAVETASSPS
jgi:MIP family channel proteins